MVSAVGLKDCGKSCRSGWGVNEDSCSGSPRERRVFRIVSTLRFIRSGRAIHIAMRSVLKKDNYTQKTTELTCEQIPHHSTG